MRKYEVRKKVMKIFEISESTEQQIGERLKSKSYKKSRKAAKASGRKRKKKLRDDTYYETATAGATSVGGGSIATVANPSITRNAKKPKKQKNGTAPNAQDSNTNLMAGTVIKR